MIIDDDNSNNIKQLCVRKRTEMGSQEYGKEIEKKLIKGEENDD